MSRRGAATRKGGSRQLPQHGTDREAAARWSVREARASTARSGNWREALGPIAERHAAAAGLVGGVLIAVIVAPIVGFLLLVALIVVCICCCCKQNKTQASAV